MKEIHVVFTRITIILVLSVLTACPSPGGAVGTNSEDQYTCNDLHTVNASVGLQVRFWHFK